MHKAENALVCARERMCVLTGEHSKRRTASGAKEKSMLDLSDMCKGFAAAACSRDRDCHTTLLIGNDATDDYSFAAAMTVPYRVECDGGSKACAKTCK